MSTSPVRLTQFDNRWFSPGASLLKRSAWFFLGAPIVRSAILPSSALRVFLLRRFGAAIGSGVVIRPGVRVKFPWRLEVGDHTWIGEDAWIDNLAPVRLGSNVCVSQGAYFCTGNHDWSDAAFGLIVKPIVVSDGAWVGAKAILSPGVALGECSVASAGSVITRDLEAYGIYAGNPAQRVRTRHVRAEETEVFSSR